MKCPNCSKEIRDGAVFCGFCGKPVAQSAKTASAVPPPKPAQGGAPPRQPVRPTPKKKRTGLIVAMCILAFLLIAGGTFGFLVYRGIIDIDIDSDSIFAFLRPADGEDAGDEEDGRRRRDKDDEEDGEEADAKEEEDGRRSRDKDEDAKDEEDDRRGRDKDEDAKEEEDSRRGRDKDEDAKEEEDGRPAGGSVPAGTGTALPDTPEERPLNFYWSGSVVACVEDPEMLWPDTRSKPFEGAAERLYWHTDHSLLVITASDTGGDIASYTNDYVWVFRNSNTDFGAALNDLVVITFDQARLSCYMARFSDATHPYDIDGLARSVGPYISRGDYEGAAVYLLKNAEEANSAGDDAEYLLPTSGTAYLTKNDLRNLTWEECCFARNEIYARHGRIFSTPAIRSYFEGKSWYSGTIAGATFDANVSTYLSALERANVNLIAEYERETWGGSFY